MSLSRIQQYIYNIIIYIIYICNNINPHNPCESQVVGAGVAGLVCARSLHRSGRCRVEVFEAADGVGGRVRSDRVPLPGPGITTGEWCQKLWLSPVVGYLYMNGVYMWPFLYMKPYCCDGYY
jgi:monoamine oxidase